MMTYYHTCEYCGANLDPDEKCDCRQEAGASKDDVPADPDGSDKEDPE